MTKTLTPNQLALIQISAELRALGDCLMDAEDPALLHLAARLRSIGRTLWEMVDELEDAECPA